MTSVTATLQTWAKNVTRTSNFPFLETRKLRLLGARLRLRVRGHPEGGFC